jgi:hypothetical protein
MRWVHINLSGLPIFAKVRSTTYEIKPNWILIENTKGGKLRLIPMNKVVREELAALKQVDGADKWVFPMTANPAM